MISLTRTKKSAAAVGIDLDDRSVAAAAIAGGGGTDGVGIAALPPGAMRDGEVVDQQAVADALRGLFSEHKLPKQVRLAIANQRVAFRTIQLPPIDDPEQLASAVRFQAQSEIPMPLESAVLDHQVIGSSTDEDGNRRLEVAVVAARRESVGALLEAARRAGLEPVGIDLAAFGMIRALAGGEESTDRQASDAADFVQATLFCNLGDTTNLAIARGRACLFSRVAQFGVRDIAREVVTETGVVDEHTEQWLLYVGLETPLDQLEGDADTVRAVRDALEGGVVRLADELRLSLDYYGTQEGATPVDDLVICGWGSAIPGLPEALGRELGRKAEAVVPPALTGFDRATAARLTLPYGIAMER